MLDRWNWKSGICILGMALAVASELAGIMDTGDRMQLSGPDKRRLRQLK